jgi:hypothetical protein
VHRFECDIRPEPTALEPLEHDEIKGFGYLTRAIAAQNMALRLMCCIGLENIKQTALENKPLKSFMGNPRTKGFQDGILQTANLEALLSLEDNFDKLDKDDLNYFGGVSSKIITSIVPGL